MLCIGVGMSPIELFKRGEVVEKEGKGRATTIIELGKGAAKLPRWLVNRMGWAVSRA
jgi:hypothetical protein